MDLPFGPPWPSWSTRPRNAPDPPGGASSGSTATPTSARRPWPRQRRRMPPLPSLPSSPLTSSPPSLSLSSLPPLPPPRQFSFSDVDPTEPSSPSPPPLPPFPNFLAREQAQSYFPLPSPPPSAPSVPSLDATHDVERLAGELSRHHLEGERTMATPASTTPMADNSFWPDGLEVDPDADSNLKDLADNLWPIQRLDSLDSLDSLDHLPLFRLRSMSSLTAAAAAAMTASRKTVMTTTATAGTSPSSSYTHVPAISRRLPLSAAALALPHLAPAHHDVPSSGYDLRRWLDTMAAEGVNESGSELRRPRVGGDVEFMDMNEGRPDVFMMSPAVLEADNDKEPSLEVDLSIASIVSVDPSVSVEPVEAIEGAPPASSLRLAAQPGGIRKLGLMRPRLSAADVALRCPNLVPSRPRMRRRCHGGGHGGCSHASSHASSHGHGHHGRLRGAKSMSSMAGASVVSAVESMTVDVA